MTNSESQTDSAPADAKNTAWNGRPDKFTSFDLSFKPADRAAIKEMLDNPDLPEEARDRATAMLAKLDVGSSAVGEHAIVMPTTSPVLEGFPPRIGDTTTYSPSQEQSTTPDVPASDAI